jgi:hypothetical protein
VSVRLIEVGLISVGLIDVRLIAVGLIAVGFFTLFDLKHLPKQEFFYSGRIFSDGGGCPD